MHAPDVLIVGAGVIGLACARALSQAGVKVTLVDQGLVGAHCSQGNCGHILPSHVLPLNSWSKVRSGLAGLLNDSAPFRIKPQLDPALWAWLLRFLSKCGEDAVWSAARALKPLLDYSADQYAALARLHRSTLSWRDEGLLYVFETEAGLSAFDAEAQALDAQLGIEADWVQASALEHLEPALRPGLAGGYLYRQDASLSPERLVSLWRSELEAAGVAIIEQCEFKALKCHHGQVVELQCGEQFFTPDHVVFAMGAMSAKLARLLDIRVPVIPGKGYSITVDPLAREIRLPWVLPEYSVAMTPFDDGLRIGSMMELAGFDDSVPEHRIHQLRQSAEAVLDAPLPADERERWMGWRPMTPDSLPLIGAAPGLSNVTLATGHQMIGVMTAPGTGQLVADQILGRVPAFAADAFAPERFHS